MADGLFGGGGAAFGVYPQMQPRRSQQDVQGSANIPVDVLRGRIAGLFGLVPDMLNFMGRSPMPTETFGNTQYQPEQQIPYGSEYFLKNLPLAPTSRAGEVAGQAASFVPLNPLPAARAVAAGGRALGPTAARMTEEYLQRQGLMPGVLPAGSKATSKIDEITGLPLNSDGTVTLFHHTNKSAAEQIAKSGRLKSAGEPSVYLTTQKTTDTGYGDVAVPVRVKPSLLNLDDEFPGGRMDFSIDTGKPKGSISVIVEKQSLQAPQQAARDLAQQRAALPVEQGGLGLPAGNTAEQRAAIMFPNDAYHGTNRTFNGFDNSMLGVNTGAKSAQKAHFVSPSSTLANSYVKTNDIYNQSPPALKALFDKPGAWEEFSSAPTDAAKWSVLEKYGLNTGSGQVLPLKVNLGQSKVVDYAGSNYRDTSYNDAIKAAKKSNKDSVVFKNTFDPGGESQSGMADVYAIMNPDNIRSRFAAFDPFRRNAAIAAAMGVAAPDLLASPMYTDPFGNTITDTTR